MSNVNFTDTAWQQYIGWQSEDKKTLKRINLLIQDMQRNPFSGIGKPEPLKENLSGFWSRRIDDQNRIVYKFENNTLSIISCKTHYKNTG
jgi:toxin YoeB